MRKTVTAVGISCVLLFVMLFASFTNAFHANAISNSEITSAAVTIIVRNEGNYGSVNANDNGACSIGALQWHATRALNLLQKIAAANPTNASNILGSSLYNEVVSSSSWSYRTLSSGESSAVSALLTTAEGTSIQDSLASSDVSGYIASGQQLGISNAGVLVFYAEVYNRGCAIAARVARNAANSAGSYSAITLSGIYQAAVADSGNSSGYFTARLTNAYNYINSLGWGDASASGDAGSTQETPSTSDFSESYAGTYTVTASSLNMRSGPATSCSKVTTIPNGTTVTVTSGNGAWAAVSYNGMTGYCSMDYLAQVAAETTTTAATTAEETTTTTTTVATTEAPVSSTEETTTTPATTQETVVTTVANNTVGVADSNYMTLCGDVNCDGEVTILDAVLLHIEVGALDVSDEVALVDVGTLGDVQLGDGAGVAGHDVGLVGGLHRAAGLADVGAVVFCAPHHEEEDEGSRQENERVAERRQLFLHHDAAVLQLVDVADGRRHITSSP